MTRDKFQIFCEQVLVPRLGNLLHGRFADLIELQDTMGQEIHRLGDVVERLSAELERHNQRSDQG